jgi:hypothetical protein
VAVAVSAQVINQCFLGYGRVRRERAAIRCSLEVAAETYFGVHVDEVADGEVTKKEHKH